MTTLTRIRYIPPTVLLGQLDVVLHGYLWNTQILRKRDFYPNLDAVLIAPSGC